jgi:signal transduction histidine kinase/ligand-binding sensor domain-containing protein/DNA-binding response OmpR family regulator
MNRLIIFFLLCFSSLLKAENLHFTGVLSTGNGLLTNEVRQVCQDSEGYIWIATLDGLCRYDGYQIKTYKSNLYTPGLLSSNRLNHIAEDGNNRIWIGTSNGLNVLDKTTGEIRRIASDKLNNNDIQVILVTRNNRVRIGTANGLHEYVAEKDSFVCYNASNTNNRFRGYNIKTLYEDSRGDVWIGTWSEGLARLDADEGVFYTYPQLNPQNSAHIIFEDDRHAIWVGTWGYGLVRLENPYDPEKVRYVRYGGDPGRPGALPDNLVYALSQDLNTGAIWVGTRSGLSVLNDRDDTYSFTNYLPGQSGLPYNEVNSIIRDRSGLMWLGMLGGGVYTVNTTRAAFNLNRLEPVKNRMASNSVRSIYVDSRGVHWLGIGSYGLVSYHPGEDRYVFYEDHPDFKDNAIGAAVHHVTQIGDAYWIASHGHGIYVYTPAARTGKVGNIRPDTHPWLDDDVIYFIKPMPEYGEVWIGASMGVYIYDMQTGRGASCPLPGQAEGGMHCDVHGIEEGDGHTVWLATGKHGIFRVERESSGEFKIRSYSVENDRLNNDNIQCVYKDGRGALWAGSDGGGLSRYDAGRDVFVSVHQAYNLPGDIVFNITEDNEGGLWLGTNAGLIVLGRDGHVRQYTVADGLQDNSFVRNAIFRTPAGELFFGGHDGYNHFFPEELRVKAFVAPVRITDIKIHNKSLETLPARLRSKISPNAPGYAREIRLPDDQDDFSIEFAALNYAGSGSAQGQYAYRLDGYDREWRYTDALRRYAAYNNMRSGAYAFHLKALNDNGVWNECEPLQVIVLPPFWQTWWAYLIYCAVLGAMAYSGWRMAKNRLLMQNAIRVKDLEKQKMEELNHAKLQFFTDITHELLTPLSIISASVDELKQELPADSQACDVISGNTARLVRLIRQILEFRKVENRKLQLKVSSGNVTRFLQKSVSAFVPLVRKKKLSIRFEYGKEYSGWFDVDKLDKIMYNLLSNAAKYTPEGGTITVRQSYDESSGVLTFDVNNPGEVIPEEKLAHLFERFYEGEYRKFHTTGTGIGLSLTRDLVTAHHGVIRVCSDRERGNTFAVELPIVRHAFKPEEMDDSTEIADDAIPSADGIVGRESDAETVADGDGAPSAPAILLVEDNEELPAIMQRLSRKKYRVMIARNGSEALAILGREEIDLIVSDVMMPGMDGMELCRRVKTTFETCHIPFILLTAKTGDEDRVTGYESGADGYITKPVRMTVLFARVDNLLKKQKRMSVDFRRQLVFEARELNYTSMDEQFVRKAVDCVNVHLDDSRFEHAQFVAGMGMSRTTLADKLKLLTGLTPSGFINNVRLQAALRLIGEKKKIRMSDLAYAVGFSDPKYFSACFKKKFGMTPSEYMEKQAACPPIPFARR